MLLSGIFLISLYGGLKMRRFTTFSLVVAASLVAGSASADVVWTGAGADANAVFADDNYDFSGSALSTIEAAPSTVGDNVTYTGANITTTDNNAFNLFLIEDGFTVTFDGTSYTTGGTGGLNGLDTFSSFVDIVNGSSASLQYVAVGLTVFVDGTSSLTIRGGGDGINSQTEATSVTLAQGGQLSLPTVAEFTEQGGEIFAANAAGVLTAYSDDNSILSFNGTTATAVNAIVPEPGSLALLGLGGLALIRRRRA